MATVLTVTANPLLNFIATQPVAADQVNRVDSLQPAAEGKGVNVARLLARHSHRVVATGFAGGHSGAWLTDLVAAAGIETAFVATAAPLRVGFMAPGQAGSHPTTVFANGFAVTADEAAALLAVVNEYLATVDLVIAAGSISDPERTDFYRDLLARCAAVGTPCWLDSYGPAMDRALSGAHAPALVKPNREEYARSNAWDRAGEVHRTDGGALIEVRAADGAWRVTPPVVDQVNPVGSGDCYLAALAHAQLVGWPRPRALAYAAAAGAANAARDDIAAIGPNDIAALTDAATVRAITA